MSNEHTGERNHTLSSLPATKLVTPSCPLFRKRGFSHNFLCSLISVKGFYRFLSPKSYRVFIVRGPAPFTLLNLCIFYVPYASLFVNQLFWVSKKRISTLKSRGLSWGREAGRWCYRKNAENKINSKKLMERAEVELRLHSRCDLKICN